MTGPRAGGDVTGGGQDAMPLDDSDSSNLAFGSDDGSVVGVAEPTVATELRNAVETERAQTVFERPDAGLAFLVDVEQLVRRQLSSLLPGARQGARLLSEEELGEEFVVRGLSMRVPNEDRERVRRHRANLLGQLGFVQRQQAALERYYSIYRSGDAAYAIEERERAEAERQRLLRQFVAPRSLTLLKPAAERRRLNDEWRKALGTVITEIVQAYRTATEAAITRYSIVGTNVETTAYEFVDTVVTPVLLEFKNELRSATFEDMPTTAEDLRNYFDRYMEAALWRLTRRNANVPMTAPPPSTRSESGGGGGGSAAESLSQLLRVPDDIDPEEALEVAFLANIVTLYANREYRDWFRQWLTAARADAQWAPFVADDAPNSPTQRLRAFVDRLVTDSEAAHRAEALARKQSSGSRVHGPVYYRVPRPPTKDNILQGYRTLVVNKISLERANVVANDGARRTYDAIDEFLRTPSATGGGATFASYWLLKYPASDVYALLDIALREEKKSLDAASIVELDARADMIRVALGKYVGRPDRPFAAHAPNDTLSASDPAALHTLGNVDKPASPGSVDDWTTYDLSYPLDRQLSEQAIERLLVRVRNEQRRYDANALHESADELRAALDHHYADRVLRREIADLTYMLKNVLSEERDAPLTVERMLGSHERLELRVEMALAPAIDARLRAAGDGDGVSQVSATDRATIDRLSTARFEFRWFRLPRSITAHEEEVARHRTRRGVPRDALLVYDDQVARRGNGGKGASVSEALAMSGRYRVEAREIIEATADAGETFGDRVYNSLFQATIVVVARCVRDNVLFEPRSDETRHGECQWRETASTAAHEQLVAELRTLVHDGPEAHRALLQQSDEIDDYVRLYHVPRVLLLPPWRSSASADLLGLARESHAQRDRLFSFDATLSRYLARFAAVFRAAAAPGTLDWMPLAKNDIDLVFASAAYAQLATLARPDRAVARADRDAWAMASAATTAPVSAIDLLPISLPRVAREGAKRIDDILRNILSRPSNTAGANAHDHAVAELGSAIGVEYEQPVVLHMSLATLLRCLALPASQVLMTARERRYFSRLRDSFIRFVDAYREKRYEALSLPAHRPISTLDPLNAAVRGRLVVIERAVDRELAAMSTRHVFTLARRYDAAEFGTMLIDTDSRRELDTLLASKIFSTADDAATLTQHVAAAVYQLPQTVVGGMRRVADRVAQYDGRWFGTQTLVDVSAGFGVGQSTRSKPLAAGSRQTVWLGTHAVHNTQPSTASVRFDQPVSLAGAAVAPLQQRAVAIRGSEPIYFNYDYDGLYEKLQYLCAQYTVGVADKLGTPASARAFAAAKAAEIMRLALIYNYFAFVAPPSPSFISADEILLGIKSQRWGRLSFEPPLVALRSAAAAAAAAAPISPTITEPLRRGPMRRPTPDENRDLGEILDICDKMDAFEKRTAAGESLTEEETQQRSTMSLRYFSIADRYGVPLVARARATWLKDARTGESPKCTLVQNAIFAKAQARADAEAAASGGGGGLERPVLSTTAQQDLADANTICNGIQAIAARRVDADLDPAESQQLETANNNIASIGARYGVDLVALASAGWLIDPLTGVSPKCALVNAAIQRGTAAARSELEGLMRLNERERIALRSYCAQIQPIVDKQSKQQSLTGREQNDLIQANTFVNDLGRRYGVRQSDIEAASWLIDPKAFSLESPKCELLEPLLIDANKRLEARLRNVPQ